MSHFDGNTWGNNGPTRVSSAFRLYCKNIFKNTSFPATAEMENFKRCIAVNGTSREGVSILNSKFGYPLHWKNWEALLNPNQSVEIFKLLEANKTFALHLWSKITKGNFEHKQLPDSPYAQVFSVNCPLMYAKIF